MNMSKSLAERLSLRHPNDASLDDARGLAAGIGVNASEACVSKTGINAENTHGEKPIRLA
jgi:hypothetical protein